MTTKVIFNSAKRYAGTNQEPRFILPNVGIPAKSCYVSKISIPHTFYNIGTRSDPNYTWGPNNSKINWIDSIGGVLTSIISQGNYSIDELLAAIGTSMTTSATDGLTYTATKNTITNKVTITNSGPTNFQLKWSDSTVTFEKDSEVRNLAKMLGFTNQETPDDFFGDDNKINDLSGAATYTGENVYFIGFTKNIYIKSNLISKSREHQSIAYFNNLTLNGGAIIDTGKNDVLVQVPVTGTYGDYITHTPQPGYEAITLDNRSSVTEVNFSLEDDNFNILGLNGQPWVCEVVFIN
jgi:hypothetical protein